MRVGAMKGGLVALVVGLAWPALAIEATDVGGRLLEGRQLDVQARVGLGALTGDAGDVTITGPLLGIGATANFTDLIGVEASFEGQRLPINDPNVPADEQAMYRWAGGLLAKAGPMLLQETLRPYVGAGFALSYWNATEEAEFIYRNDWVGEVPVAVGADYFITENISAGIQGSYRWLIGDEFAPNLEQFDRAEGSLINGFVTVGGRF